MSYNKVILIGNLGKDPEVRKLQNNTVASFTLATSRRFKNAQGQVVSETDWHNIECWGRVAEVVAQYLHKGSKVLVEGELRYRSYKAQDGQNRNVTEIRANSMEILDTKQQSAAPQPAPQPFFMNQQQAAPTQQYQPQFQPQAAPAPQAPQYQPAQNIAPNIDDFPGI
jgi:single-strand DNA-binding protein